MKIDGKGKRSLGGLGLWRGRGLPGIRQGFIIDLLGVIWGILNLKELGIMFILSIGRSILLLEGEGESVSP